MRLLRLPIRKKARSAATHRLGSTPVRDVGERQTTHYANDPYPSQRAAQDPCGKNQTLV